MKDNSRTPEADNAAKPEGMTSREWQISQRRRAAEKRAFAVAPVAGHWSGAAFSVGSPRSRRQYTVVYHGRGNAFNSCGCLDFRTSGLGTCKHIEAVGLWLAANDMPDESPLPRRTVLDVSYADGRRLRLRTCRSTPRELSINALRYFDDDSLAVPGRVEELTVFIARSKKIDKSFHCTTDALNLILEERDRNSRSRLCESISAADINKLIATHLYPYQIEGIRFAFRAGRALIADEMGMGKTVQALGTAELFRRHNMVASVLVVCPTSLKYHWQKEIDRFTRVGTTIVEGPAKQRRDLYAARAPYTIVSYHTLANDIKALGTLNVDMVIFDEVQRLAGWSAQITQAARRIESDYAVVLSGTPLQNNIEELYSVMQFVDQYALGPLHSLLDGTKDEVIAARLKNCMLRRSKADVAQQMPSRTDTVLYVPMTREQKEIHDEALDTVARLVQKWQRYNFLSEKDRKRLLLLLGRMRMVCDSTYLIDLKTDHGTKVAETVQLIASMLKNGDGKAVIFSQWERMAQLVARELDAAGIAFEYIAGNISAARRAEALVRFYDGATRVVIATDAASAGLNLPDASVVINLDLPWDSEILEKRVLHVFRYMRRNVQVINLVAAGTFEERMQAALNSKHNLLRGVAGIGNDSITLDDSALTGLSEAVSHILEVDVTDARPDDTEEESTAGPETAEAVPAPAGDSSADELIRCGMAFVGKLAETLRSPQATQNLIDTVVHSNPETGRKELRVPVSDDFIIALKSFLNR